MNTFLKEMQNDANYKYTENGAVAYKSTNSAVYDMFAFGAAYRNRTAEDVILLFKNAFEENRELALKCLFYIGDCRGGQGERRFFRLCFNWLAERYPEIARKNLEIVPVYRRWDDVIYSCFDTPVEADMLALVKHQLALDIECKTPSLLAKWLPSENASSAITKEAGSRIRVALGMNHKQYRKVLSALRTRINIVEKLMSEGRWDEIEFDKIPSRAGLIYKNAFARRDLIAQKYAEFANDENKKVNAAALYPYEIVGKALDNRIHCYRNDYSLSDTDRKMIEKYWNNLPDYFEGKQSDMLCVVDTSGSMWGTPINVAISLGMYCAERAGGPFKDHYISFSSRPQLVHIEGTDFVDKVVRIQKTNLCENTDLTATFDMLLNIADRPDVKEEDIPSTIVVISDMEIDDGGWYRDNIWHEETAPTEMERVRQKWAEHGHKLPRLIYWNVNARNNTILDAGPTVSFVSGMSPSIFTSIITGKNGIDLMMDAITAERYSAVTV